MRTADGTSHRVSAGNGLFSLLGFMGLYALLSIVYHPAHDAASSRRGAPAPAAAGAVESRGRRYGDALVLARRADAGRRTSCSTASISASACSTAWVARTPRRARNRAPLDRAGVGRQRGLAARRRRHAVLRVSRALRLQLQRLLPAVHGGALAAHRPRARARAARSPADAVLGRRSCDAIFTGVEHGCSPVFFGAALGNVVRGVPLDPDGYFFVPLWTHF